MELFRTIARTEGLRGLYRGLGVTLTLGPFASVLYFTGYEVRGLPAVPCSSQLRPTHSVWLAASLDLARTLRQPHTAVSPRRGPETP